MRAWWSGFQHRKNARWRASARCGAIRLREVQGAIFAYFGDEQQPDPVELQLPEELTDDAYGSFLCTALWRCNYRYAIDNVMDPMHGANLQITFPRNGTTSTKLDGPSRVRSSRRTWWAR